MKLSSYIKGLPFFLAAFLLAGCSASFNDTGFSSGTDAAVHRTQNSKITKTGFFFHTVVSVTLYGTEDASILEDCFLRMNEYEKMLSKTVEGSDIWRINHSNGAVTRVSEETAVLLRMADHYSGLSGGAFDITVAPVVSLWDFTGEAPHTVPAEADISAALEHVDYQKLIIHDTQVTLADTQAQVDTGGIAKGYIADRIKSYLEGRGVSCGIISLGGNILTFGTKPDGSPWNIAVRRPFGASSEAITTVKTDSGVSVVTSGTYERYFELDGTLYHHILDPDTGYPVDNGLVSVTILSESSAEGDALSTACFVLGIEKGMELIESLEHVEALFITEDMKLHRSSGFPEN